MTLWAAETSFDPGGGYKNRRGTVHHPGDRKRSPGSFFRMFFDRIVNWPLAVMILPNWKYLLATFYSRRTVTPPQSTAALHSSNTLEYNFTNLYDSHSRPRSQSLFRH